MSDTTHHTLDQLYRRFASYGREIPNVVSPACPNDSTLSLSVLMRLVSLADGVVEALAKVEVDRRYREAFRKASQALSEWRKDLEARHGKCPESVVCHVERLAFTVASEHAGDTDRWRWVHVGVNVHPGDMPANVRKDYDRWRKRRIKKEPAK